MNGYSVGSDMAKAAPIITSFNSGEWSPLMAGRTDIKYYPSACKKTRNFIPTPQGPARFRPGFRHVTEVKNSAHREWLWRFEFNVAQSYILEFGDNFVRYFANHGRVMSPVVPTNPLEVASPYPIADLTAADGTFALRTLQSGDVVYIVHPKYPPQKMSRTGAASFSFAEYEPTCGPFQDVDPKETRAVYASAATGVVTLTANAAIFVPTYVGTQFYIENQKANAVKQWEAGKVVAAGSLRRSDGKTYYTSAGGTTGNVKPTHSSGSLYDGDTGVLWDYQDAGYGWVKITAVAGDHLSCTATVLSALPYGCVGTGQPSTRWAYAAWNSFDGYPTEVTMFRERLTFLRGRDGWGSVSADFDDMSRKDSGGVVTKDMALVFTVNSDTANDIQWACPLDVALIVGTAGDEHAILENTVSEAFGPGNCRARKQSDYGSKHTPAIRVGEGILYVQKSGQRVRDCVMAESVNERWVSKDATILAEHATKSGIVSWAYQQEPDSVVWAALGNGGLVGFTINREQDVKAWHPHTIGGTDVAVESVAVIPSPDGTRDEVWAIIKRTINGATKRYIEYGESQHDDGDDQADIFYVDSGLTYRGAPTLTLSGLGHLEGETVSVIVDGAAHPTRIVTGGQITLQGPISTSASITAHVGLGYSGVLMPMPIDAGGADGTSQGKVQRPTKVGIRFYHTGAAKYGRDDESGTQLDKIELRGGGDRMDAATPLFTGDKVVSWPDGYEGYGQIAIVQDLPQPCNVVALMPHIVTQDSPASKGR